MGVIRNGLGVYKGQSTHLAIIISWRLIPISSMTLLDLGILPTHDTMRALRHNPWSRMSLEHFCKSNFASLSQIFHILDANQKSSASFVPNFRSLFGRKPRRVVPPR